MTIDASDRVRLLTLARQSISTGGGRAAPTAWPPLKEMSATLRAPQASFVTLHLAGLLRGCRGTLEAERPLAHDVWENAWLSAYEDPRFPLLGAAAVPAVEISVSVLSALEPVAATNPAELLGQIEPGRHGLVLVAGAHRATFLPQVWSKLATPARFLDALLAKAGLPAEPWSPLTQAWRYTAESFSEAPVTGH